MSFKPLDLTGKVAVVIGGTSGIGRAIALGLADAGADVVPSSRRIEEVEKAAAEIESRGRRSLNASQGVCWYSWPEQMESVELLTRYEFQWVLPGHGERVKLPPGETRRQLLALSERLRAA